MSGDNVVYFNSFGFEHILKEIKKFFENKNILNIYRIQAYNSTILLLILVDTC